MKLHQGFTLIELLTTIMVVGILAAIAMPAFTSFVQNDRDTGQVNSLVASFNYARSEAVKRASPNGVIVCSSTDGQTCTGTPWSGGWIALYQDLVTPANTTVLQAVPALSGTNQLTAAGPTPFGITFASSGLVSAPLTIKICDVRGGAFARDVEVNATGRVAASQTPGLSASQVALACP
jgi:prepilin-type N-terminal cleavage/methylation domain-containing protein